MTDQIPLIINAAAGCGHPKEWSEGLVVKFRDHGLDVDVRMVRGGSELVAAAKRAIDEGATTIVAGGGDGTVSAVASSLTGTGIRLGVLPLGTLNHFAKDLRIPLQIDEAVQTIGSGHCIQIDAGEVNGKIFLNNSGIGLYPDMVMVRDAEQRRHGTGKWRAFIRAATDVLRRYPFVQAQLLVDGLKQVHRTPCVFVGNNEYTTSGVGLGSRKCLANGVLSVYVVRAPTRLAFFALAVRALFGRPRRARDFEALLATEMVIETRQPRKLVSTDGEVSLMDTPLQFRILPKTLNVIVPENPQPNPGK